MSKLAYEIDKAVYVAASLIIHNGGSLDARVQEVADRYPMVDKEILYGGVKYHWTEIMQRRVA